MLCCKKGELVAARERTCATYNKKEKSRMVSTLRNHHDLEPMNDGSWYGADACLSFT